MTTEKKSPKKGTKNSGGSGGFMTKKLALALALIGFTALVLVFNTRGAFNEINLNVLVTEIKTLRSVIFFGFTTVGVVIGLLLK